MRKSQGLIRHRYVMCVMIFLANCFVYSMRTNLSVTIIAMVKPEDSGSDVSNNTEGTCPAQGGGHNDTSEVHGDLDWDTTTQSYALLAFFAGYLSTQIIGGILSEKYSVKTVLGLSIFLTSLLTFLTEVMAKWSIYSFVVLRVLEGCTEGTAYPAIYGLMARWAPKQERSTMLNLCLIGTVVGTIVTLPAAAALCQSAWGWPAAFYLPAGLGVVWSIVWYLIAASGPESHKWISDDEKEYIIENRGAIQDGPKKIPWGKMLRSRPVWALSATAFSYCIIFYMFLTEMPTFLNNVFHINLVDNGSLNAAFYICSSISMMVSAMAADQLINRFHIGRTTVRKLFEAGSSYITTAILLTIVALGCNYKVIKVLLCVAMLTLPMVAGGNLVVAIDMAPNMAGSVMAFANTIANLAGIVAPLIVGQLTTSNGNLSDWHNVFYVTAGISVAGSTTFLLFGTSKEQEWATPEEALIEAEPREEEA